MDFLNKFFNDFIAFFEIEQQKFLHFFPLIKLMAGVFSGVFFIIVVWLVVKTQILAVKIRELAEAIRQSPTPKKKALKEWGAITARLQRGSESDLKLAIIEADKLLDDTVRRMGFAGETMAERLKKITPAQLSNIENIRSAHKVRNNIVHGPDYRLTRLEAETAIGVYEKALREWGLID